MRNLNYLLLKYGNQDSEKRKQRALNYIASSGLRALLRMRKAAAAKGNKVTLQGVNTNIMEVLQVTHFDKMFEFC